jgi:lysyl-tRNA synthetase class 2
VQRRFLQTSPELAMKRLVAAGLPRIFQIAAVFRDGDLGPVHRPEFRLLEWYRAGAPWTALMDDCEALLRHLARALHGVEACRYGGLEIDLARPFRRISVDEAFRTHAGFSILEALTPAPLMAQLDRLGIAHRGDDTWDDLFHRVFLTRVEPALLQDPRPLFLTHYPAPLASLARLAPEDPRAAERFELYVGGLELANAFGELVDAATQRTRFELERAARAAAGKRDYPLDEAFLAALKGMPEAAGIALGMERLLMVLLDAPDIDAVSFLPWGDA